MSDHRIPRWTRRLAGGATVIVVLAGVYGAAALAAPRQSGPDPRLAEHDVEPAAQDVLPTPPGMTAVSGSEGHIVGFLRNRDMDGALVSGEPELGLRAEGIDLRGLEVVDATGALIGYFLSGDTGFVSLEQIRQPGELGRIARQWAADQHEASAPVPPDVQVLIDELDAQAGGTS